MMNLSRLGLGFGRGRPMAPSLPLYFGGHLDSRITFSRASSGWYPEADGSLVEFGADEPRIGDRGLLIEGARTNHVRNPRGEGAVPGVYGSGGQFPSAWTTYASADLSTEVVGVGVERGIPYTDLRVFGTPTAAFYVFAFQHPQPESEPEYVWSGSLYMAVVGGSLSGVSNVQIQVRDTAATALDIQPTATLQRFGPVTRTTPEGRSGATLAFGLNFDPDTEIDVTLRLGAPQLERGAYITSPILPPVGSPAVTTRAADVATIDLTEAAWFNPAQGTILIEAELARLNSGTNAFLIDLYGGAIDESLRVYVNSAGGFTMSGDTGGQSQGSIFGGTQVAGQRFRVAAAYAENNVALAVDGEFIGADTQWAMPTMTQLRIGGRGDSTFPLNGYIRRLTYWPRRLSDEELVRKTS